MFNPQDDPPLIVEMEEVAAEFDWSTATLEAIRAHLGFQTKEAISPVVFSDPRERKRRMRLLLEHRYELYNNQNFRAAHNNKIPKIKNYYSYASNTERVEMLVRLLFP